jgi:hypothetical protein
VRCFCTAFLSFLPEKKQKRCENTALKKACAVGENANTIAPSHSFGTVAIPQGDRQ